MAGNYDIILTIFLWWFIHVFPMAQNPIPIVTAYASGTFEADRFSADRPVFHLNPALLPFQENTIFSGHIENRFTGFDLTTASFLVSHSFPGSMGAGISFFHFGFPEYQNTGVQIIIGKKLSKTLSLGISESISRSRVLGEGRPWQGQTLVSFLWRTPVRGAMISADGLMAFGLPDIKNQFHSHIKLEIAGFQKLQPSTMVFILMKHEAKTLYGVAGIRQKILEKTEFYASFQVYPARYGAGITIPLPRSILCMISTRYHPILGWSPSLGLQKNMTRKNNSSARK